MYDILIWIAILILLSIASIPLGALLLEKEYDFGTAFYKIIGLVSVGFFLWITISLKIITFSRVNCWLFFLFFIIFNSFIFLKIRTRSIFSKNLLKSWILYELSFICLFFIFAVYRSYNSQINVFERPFDMALTMNIFKNDSFPPNDAWLSGEKVGYYYFGHFLTALLSKMSGIKIEIVYNLMLNTVYSFFVIGTFSIILNLTKRKFWAFVAIISSCFSANLNHFIFFINSSNKLEKFNWWTSSRVIPGTINEFPFFSFLVGDLHAHFISLYILPLIIILSFSFAKKPTLAKSFFSGIVLAIIFMTNSWNFLIFFPIFILLFWIFLFFKTEGGMPLKNKLSNFIRKNFIIIPAILISLVVVCYFILSIKSGSQEFMLVTTRKTDLSDLFILFPLQFIVAGFFLIHIFMPNLKNKLKNENRKKELGVYLFFITSILILLFCELFYLKDLLSNGEWQRMNTVFKFYYQFWVLSSVWMIYFAYKIAERKNLFSKIFLFIFFSILTINVSYVYWGVKQSIGDFSKKPTLDGMRFIKESDPDEYSTILWIRDNISKQKVIAEKPGVSFTKDSQISIFTGNLTPLGWFDHEWTWRSKEVGKLFERKADLEKFFLAKDVTTAETIAKKYQIDFIYLGKRERDEYRITIDSAIYKLGDIVFQKGNSELIKIN